MVSKPTESRLLDLNEAAHYLNVSTWVIRSMELNREIIPVRLRGGGRTGKKLRKLLYDREDLDKIIKASKA